jgi:hypothetical protein
MLCRAAVVDGMSFGLVFEVSCFESDQDFVAPGPNPMICRPTAESTHFVIDGDVLDGECRLGSDQEAGEDASDECYYDSNLHGNGSETRTKRELRRQHLPSVGPVQFNVNHNLKPCIIFCLITMKDEGGKAHGHLKESHGRAVRYRRAAYHSSVSSPGFRQGSSFKSVSLRGRYHTGSV